MRRGAPADTLLTPIATMRTTRTHLRAALAVTLALLASSAQAVTITADPQPLTRVAGDYAVFSVQATGTGTLTYQWRKDGADIPGATQQGLVLNPISAADAADYSVVVSDSVPSSATSANAALTVNAPDAGDLDFSFGGASINLTVYAVAVQSDGMVLIGGGFTSVHGTTINRIARLNSDGTLDTGFGRARVRW